jgi:FtsP/CotA-like multicopper oxidase with cupredoxin domain
MFIDKNASALRRREAENARRNRQEIARALTLGDVTRRDLFKWGLLTAGGIIACRNGLSPFAISAFAQVPTGTPRSPIFGARKFTQPMPRPELLKPIPMVGLGDGSYAFGTTGEPPARKFSYHQEFSESGGLRARNPVTGRGPLEGRPPTEFFAHQRWEEAPPKVGYLLSAGQVKPGAKIHPLFPAQNENSVWSFGARPPLAQGSITGSRFGSPVPQLIQMRYDEPVLCRIYNDLPDDPVLNGGFGKNQITTHLHNGHNGAESDGACNAYHYPGTFYDYRYSAMCARRDMPTIRATNVPRWQDRCSTPTDSGGFRRIEGDFRELQSSLWFHDHRFFYTAENVQKGMAGLLNYYSGPDRGHEETADGINLRLPSGTRKPWGNLDFDVNLMLTNPAYDQEGQLTYDIFDTDGYVGDIVAVNGAYYPYFEVLPRRYRFRLVCATMARFYKLLLIVEKANRFSARTRVPMYVVANDGNLLVKPIRVTELDYLSPGERYDVIVDFSQFVPGDLVQMVNLVEHQDGRRPKETHTLAAALQGIDDDPAVGSVMQFRVVSSVKSVDDPAKTYTLADIDRSVDFSAPDWSATSANFLTAQIPIERPARVREIEFKRNGGADARDPVTGECTPSCGDFEYFPWAIRIDGQETHSLNANRISALIPKPGEVEHWVLVNGSGGWDHPIHLHFEEGVTIDRAGDPIPATERGARKDVWRLGTSGRGTVRMQVRFSEFGGAYVAHCHNTVHEDFAMLLRMQVLSAAPGTPEFKGQPQWVPTQTPIPSRDGVTWKTPEILPEGDPRERTNASR